MSFLEDRELLSYNKRGFFPGPYENESQFLNRVGSFSQYSSSRDTICFESLNTAEELYDIKPDWVQIEYTALGFRFWEAAHVETSSNYFKFSLRKSFLNHPKYLGIYCKKEILAHEFAHVGRMNFPQSRFEELFAFQTSSSFRRVFGPLFSTPNQSFTLIILTLMSFLSDFLLGQIPYVWAFFKVLPLIFLGYLGLKLLFTRRFYNKAFRKMKALVLDEKKARYIVYRLTDKEIKKFSRSRMKVIKEYIAKQKNKELRWRLIYLAYFNSTI
ncbi:MAG: hypothetical protein S4CHLAM7_11210 [Chlamydiae bacterium]|nr:hypothetical protein [Chlamydiota bacterium]